MANDGDALAAVEAWLRSWPVPFAGHQEAPAFFGDTPWGRAWTDGLGERWREVVEAFLAEQSGSDPERRP